MPRTPSARAPALSVPEAAMLPALVRSAPNVPRSLQVKDPRVYIPVETGGPIVDDAPLPKERGRAALHHVIWRRAGWRR